VAYSRKYPYPAQERRVNENCKGKGVLKTKGKYWNLQNDWRKGKPNNPRSWRSIHIIRNNSIYYFIPEFHLYFLM